MPDHGPGDVLARGMISSHFTYQIFSISNFNDILVFQVILLYDNIMPIPGKKKTEEDVT